MRIKLIKKLINGSKTISHHLTIDDILCDNYILHSFVILSQPQNMCFKHPYCNYWSAKLWQILIAKNDLPKKKCTRYLSTVCN